MTQTTGTPKGRRPDWLKVKLPTGVDFQQTRSIVEKHQLNTVCQDAMCPNLAECWNNKTATFMILGDVCTRSCRFCAVKTGKPPKLDLEEPVRVASAAKKLGLRYIVVTSVNRDELEDGGAFIFAQTIQHLHQAIPGSLVEVLIPDFLGSKEALEKVVQAQPEIVNHNIETVPSLYSRVRPQAKYARSLEVLNEAKKRGMVTKTGLMMGLGEEWGEVVDLMKDLVKMKLDILTIGQYLQPSQKHLPVERFVEPSEFKELKEIGESLGIGHVESAPLVRSSYHAGDVHRDLEKVRRLSQIN